MCFSLPFRPSRAAKTISLSGQSDVAWRGNFSTVRRDSVEPIFERSEADNVNETWRFRRETFAAFALIFSATISAESRLTITSLNHNHTLNLQSSAGIKSKNTIKIKNPIGKGGRL